MGEFGRVPDVKMNALLAGIRSWDGTVAAAQPLRDEVRALGQPNSEGADVGGRALLAVASAYRRQKPDRLRFDPASEVDACRIIGPFLGDPAMGKWSWHDPLTIKDVDAVRWLPLVSAFGPADDPSILKFVFEIFGARRRLLWVPASRALAVLARRGESARSVLSSEWGRCFPSGLPERWPNGALSDDRRAPESPGMRHRMRHVLHAAAAFLSVGGEPQLLPGFEVRALAAMSLPSDDADASVVLLALSELLFAPATRGDVLAFFASRISEVRPDEMAEDVLRLIADNLRPVPEAKEVRDLIEARLKEARWKDRSGEKRVDALLSWLRTARWFQAAGARAAIGEMRAGAGMAGPALDLVTERILPGGAAGVVDAALPRLRLVFDKDVFATTADEERTVRVVELLELVGHDDLANVPWRPLVARACGSEAAGWAREGAVAAVARADLALILVARGLAAGLLLRDQIFGEADILRLATSQDEFVARQVAVQVERLLREELPSGVDQARFLWRLLLQDPPARTFVEIGMILRGRGRAIHAVVEGIGRLDGLRESGASLLEQSKAFRDLADHVAGLMVTGADGPGRADAMTKVIKGLRALGNDCVRVAELCCADLNCVGNAEWQLALERLLFGDGSEGGGLSAWCVWRGHPMEDLHSVWVGVVEAAGMVREAGMAVSPAACDEMSHAVAALKDRLCALAWPEGGIAHGMIDLAERWLADRRDRARDCERETSRVKRLICMRDEEALVGLVTPTGRAILDVLSAESVQQLGRFYLRNLMFRKFSMLRKRVVPRVRLPSVWSYLSPLLAGVAAGPLFVMDIGSSCNELIADGHEAQLWAAIGIGLVLAFWVLSASLTKHFPGPGKGFRNRMGYAGKAVGRVLPIFAISMGIAGAVSAASVWLLRGTSLCDAPDGAALPFFEQVSLWTSLGLFLGVFVGLILQGRGAVAEE